MKKTYSEKLRDPRWQKRRLEIMQRDKFHCRRCGDDANTLNVHHLIYDKGKAPWEYRDDLLVTLCEACHACVENRTIKIVKAWISMTNFNPIDLRDLLVHFLVILKHKEKDLNLIPVDKSGNQPPEFP